MPTPWLSCPARLARTRWSATSAASAASLPMRRAIRVVTACSACGESVGTDGFLYVGLRHNMACPMRQNHLCPAPLLLRHGREPSSPSSAPGLPGPLVAAGGVGEARNKPGHDG